MNLEEGYIAGMSTDLSQGGPELNLPIHLYLLKRCDKIDNIYDKELKRFWDNPEKFKVDKAKGDLLKFYLLFNLKKIK